MLPARALEDHSIPRLPGLASCAPNDRTRLLARGVLSSRGRGVCLVTLTGIVISTFATAARAGDLPESIPVAWSETTCQSIVIRDQTSTFTFAYSIASELPPPDPVEVEDSRTHQFFALSQDAVKEENALPLWITDADVDRALAADPMIPPPLAEDVLEHSTLWKDFALRITADDQRRPITFAAADEAVEWNITDVPSGTYVLAGYTWLPPQNKWSIATGFVKIVDTESDLANSAPAIAVDAPAVNTAVSNQVVTLTGCASAIEGSTYSVHWASPVDRVFEEIASDEPLEIGVDGSISIDFHVPALERNAGKMIAVDVRDPMDRVFRTYMPGALIVAPDPNCPFGTRCDMGGGGESMGDEGSTSVADTTGDSSTSSGSSSDGSSSSAGDSTSSGSTSGTPTSVTATTTGTSTTGGTESDGDDEGGSGCSVGTGASETTPAAAFTLLSLVAWRRRRYAT